MNSDEVETAVTPASAPTGTGPSDRVWTIPNALSVLRLLGVPVYMWLILGPHYDVAALVVLAVSGLTDYLDGKIARWLGQTSKIGILLDPAADRLYILVTLITFVIRDIIPWWITAILLGRELVLGVNLLIQRRHGNPPLPVHYLGKAATFCLMYAFPLLLLAGVLGGTGEDIVAPIGWAFTIWGTALYVWSGALYLWQSAALLSSGRPEPGVTGESGPE